jgi:hypothetical protein
MPESIDFSGSEDSSSDTSSSLDSESTSYYSDRSSELLSSSEDFMSDSSVQAFAASSSDPSSSPLTQIPMEVFVPSGADLGDVSAAIDRLTAALQNDLPTALAQSSPLSKANTFFNGAACMFGAVGALTVAGTFLYAIIHNIVNNKPDPQLDALADDLQSQAKAIAEQWIGQQPSDLWPKVAAFADSKNPNTTAQILILSFLKQLSPPPVENGVTWTYRNQDFDIQVALLAGIYNNTDGGANEKAAAMYRSIPGFLYDGYTVGTTQVVPVPVGAEIACYALMSMEV